MLCILMSCHTLLPVRETFKKDEVLSVSILHKLNADRGQMARFQFN